MPYDENFYQLYQEYLLEPRVRDNHDRIFRIFYENYTQPNNLKVMDLGCGLGEYYRFGAYQKYLGVDLNQQNQGPDFIQGDYWKFEFLEDSLSFEPTIFVSLFSIEACYDAHLKYHYYNALFENFPTLKYGLVSGFYYLDKSNQTVVDETGEITSYQTVERLGDYQSKIFSEERYEIRNPSKMFGENVMEVWKFLERK